MKPIQNADGHVGLTAREYPVAAATALRRGQVVRLSAGKVVAAASVQTGPVLGIAAETLSGSADVLNPRANGEGILVYDNPGLIFECPAPTLTAAGGSSTTVVGSAASIDATTADDAFNGGVLRLKSKTGSSGNTDAVGTLRPVTDYAKATFTLTVGSGGTAAAGDVYQVFPPVGFNALALDTTGQTKVILTDNGASALKVVGWDTQRGTLRLMAAAHALGTEE